MTHKEKSEAYDKALKQIKECTPDENGFITIYPQEIFPELKESEDERIKGAIIYFISHTPTVPKGTIGKETMLTWLEKQGEIIDIEKVLIGARKDVALSIMNFLDKNTLGMCLSNMECKDLEDAVVDSDWSKVYAYMKKKLEKQGEHLENYDEAEKEKADFVSGKFIQCRKPFLIFKEDESYWFEYIGDDTYIGRSDNILDQKFHITPRQLYTLFSQQHSEKDDTNEVIENEELCETNAPVGYGKYVDECLNDAAKHFFSEGEDKYSVADLFYAGVRCGKNYNYEYIHN